METRCPYANCQTVWQTDDFPEYASVQASNDFLRGVCIQCQRPATLKPLEMLLKLEKKLAYLSQQEVRLESASPPDSAVELRAVLEDLRSLHNVGSIFRSADALGVNQLYLTGISGPPVGKDFLKTSLGAHDHIHWQYQLQSLPLLEQLKESGLFLIALERNERSIDISTLRPPILRTPLCLVLGSEVSGVSEEALAACDVVCHIAMKGHKESLNVAVAFGIAAYQITQALVS